MKRRLSFSLARSFSKLALSVLALPVLTLPATALMVLPIGCVTEAPMDPVPPVVEACMSDNAYFQDEVWNAFMGTTCFGCHNAQGPAANSQLVLVGSAVANYLDLNQATVRNIAELERDGTSILLLKPSSQIDHGGGTIIEQGDDDYVALEGLIARYDNPVFCEEVAGDDFFEGVNMLDNEATLRKASLALVGRLPTADEVAQVKGGDEADLDTVLDGMFQEDAFFLRLKEMYNDKFLTNRYLRNSNATNLLDGDDYPDARYYNDLDPDVIDEAVIDDAVRYSNNSVAQAPLELIAHVVRNDRPFAEVVTADYMVVNGYSAQSYGVLDEVSFTNPADPNEWREVQLPGIPHSGVLTDPMWLNRFPTTATNRNRHRSRMAHSFFLAQDIMRLAERPVDPTAIAGFNPTMNSSQCSVCHAKMDPVAGAFQNWDESGRYRPPVEGWFTNMRPPGVGENMIPIDQYGSSLQWLGQQIAADELFDLSTVHTVWQGLSGQKVAIPPSDAAELTPEAFDAQTDTFTEQDASFKEISFKFRAENQNLKVVIKELVKSKWFRADDADNLSEARQLQVSGVGTARWLTPELLQRKIQGVLGQGWNRGFDSRPYLLDVNEFLIFYGGIDSDGVTERITEPNGLMSSIAVRMANEMGCATVARDFLLPMQARRLFPEVESTFEPFDVNGFEVAGAMEAIKANIQHLHRHLLNETLSLNDPELERTYNLFVETLQEGQIKRELPAEEGGVGRDLDGACRAITDALTGDTLPDDQQVRQDDRYVIRSWMAVMTYLLSDYRFLHE